MIRVAVVAVALVASLGAMPSADATRSTMACQNEDSPGRCVWDSRHMGNGHGMSFIRRGNGDIVYVSHRRAHRLLSP